MRRFLEKSAIVSSALETPLSFFFSAFDVKIYWSSFFGNPVNFDSVSLGIVCQHFMISFGIFELILFFRCIEKLPILKNAGARHTFHRVESRYKANASHRAEQMSHRVRSYTRCEKLVIFEKQT